MSSDLGRAPADNLSDFDAAWLRLLHQYEPAVRVTSALLRLTDAGEDPVEIGRLAEVIAQHGG